MHFCLQDNQIDPKVMGLAPADMDRLLPSKITKKHILVVNSLSFSCDYTYFELALLYNKNYLFFLLDHYPSSS
jgi:hypothetical protein